MLTLFPSPQFFQPYLQEGAGGRIPQKFESWVTITIILNNAAMKAMGYARMEDAFVQSESPTLD